MNLSRRWRLRNRWITASTPSTRQPRRRDEVAALQSNSSDDIAVGAELSGKFSGDGQYYDVIVEEVTDCVEIKSRAPHAIDAMLSL